MDFGLVLVLFFKSMQIAHSLAVWTQGTLVPVLPLQNTQLNNEENSFSYEMKSGVK